MSYFAVTMMAAKKSSLIPLEVKSLGAYRHMSKSRLTGGGEDEDRVSKLKEAEERLRRAREKAERVEELQTAAAKELEAAEELVKEQKRAETKKSASIRRYDFYTEKDVKVDMIVAAQVGYNKYVKVRIVDIAIPNLSPQRIFKVDRLDGGKALGWLPAEKLFPLEFLTSGRW